MSGITPCIWQLSCSPGMVSRASAPGMGETQEASPSRKASCCSPPARLPGSCRRCAVPPSVFIWGETQMVREGTVLLFKRDCAPSLCEKVWEADRGRRLGYSHRPVWMLLLSLSSPRRFPCPAASRASVSGKNSQPACMQSLLLRRDFYVA